MSSHWAGSAAAASILRGMSAHSHDIRPGFVLRHRGAVLGVVERVEHGRDSTVPALLHVRGGRSGALEYLIPRTAVVEVRPGADVAVVRPEVEFRDATLEPDGHVTLVARRRLRPPR